MILNAKKLYLMRGLDRDIGRYIGRYSVDTQPILDRSLADARPMLDRCYGEMPFEYRPMHRPLLSRYPFRLIVDVSADSNYRSTIGELSVMYRCVGTVT